MEKIIMEINYAITVEADFMAALNTNSMYD